MLHAVVIATANRPNRARLVMALSDSIRSGWWSDRSELDRLCRTSPHYAAVGISLKDVGKAVSGWLRCGLLRTARRSRRTVHTVAGQLSLRAALRARLRRERLCG